MKPLTLACCFPKTIHADPIEFQKVDKITTNGINKLLFVFRLSKDLIRGSLGLEALDIAHSRRAAGEGVG